MSKTDLDEYLSNIVYDENNNKLPEMNKEEKDNHLSQLDCGFQNGDQQIDIFSKMSAEEKNQWYEETRNRLIEKYSNKYGLNKEEIK